MIGLLLAPFEVSMNEQLGEILNQLANAEYRKQAPFCGATGPLRISECDGILCSCCPCANVAWVLPDKYYVAQIGKTHHELRFSNSTGTDVQPEPRETSD